MKETNHEKKAAELWHTYQLPEDVTKPNQKFWQQYEALIDQSCSDLINNTFPRELKKQTIAAKTQTIAKKTSYPKTVLKGEFNRAVWGRFGWFLLGVAGAFTLTTGAKKESVTSIAVVLGTAVAVGSIYTLVTFFNRLSLKFWADALAIEKDDMNWKVLWDDIKQVKISLIKDYKPLMEVETVYGDKKKCILRLDDAKLSDCSRLLDNYLGKRFVHSFTPIPFEKAHEQL